ncbi:MAG: SDR family NAD(P)-dependent oxidoreductase [Candidatus Saccharibacteria bacterium]
MLLNNKTILITGANRGIGRALAEELAKYPVNLLLGMRDVSKYQPIIGGKALIIKPLKLDMGSLESIQKDIKAAAVDLKELDILINNAGQYLAGPLEKQDPVKLASMVQVNLTGLMQLTAELMPTLRRKRGKVVNNASIAGYAYFPFNGTYSATKAGVVAFSESLRREQTDVSVLHLVTPGVATEMMDDVNAAYANNGRPVNLKTIPADVWATKVAKAIRKDKTILTPGGAVEVSRILSKGPRFLIDIISRWIVKKTASS